MHPPKYTPKWGNKVSVTQKEDQVCMYPSCTANNELIALSFVLINELKAALQVHSDSKGQKLCSKHYQELYWHLTSQPCASCGINPKPGSSFARHGPNASMINSILYGGSIQDMLTSNDYISSINKNLSNPLNHG